VAEAQNPRILCGCHAGKKETPITTPQHTNAFYTQSPRLHNASPDGFVRGSG